MNLSQMQKTQPWLVPYSDEFHSANEECPYLFSTHAVLHAAKSVGKLAAIFEDLDHSEPEDLEGYKKSIADMAADLVTVALRLANLNGFDLEGALRRRVIEKNGVSFEEASE